MVNTLCCFPIEIKARDFDPRLYQALMCIKQNQHFSSLIGGKGKVNEQIFMQQAPFLYFAKGMNNHPPSLRFWNKIHQRGGKIIYLDEECGPARTDPRLFLLRYTPEVLHFVNIICSWGEQQKSVIVKHRPSFPAENIVVTGHPRFDLKKPRFTSYFKALQQDQQSNMKNYILFNLNFGLVNSHFTKEQMNERRFNDTEKRSPGVLSKEDMLEHYEFQEQVRSRFIQAIKAVAIQYSDEQIVVRPHLGEVMQTYVDEFQGIENIMVNQDGSVHEWIIDAKLVIHHDCTTAVETYFHEKIPIAYNPVPCNADFADKFVNVIPISISQVSTNESELVASVGQRIDGYKQAVWKKAGEETIIQAYANMNFDSAVRIAEEAEKVAVQNDIDISEELVLKYAPADRKSPRVLRSVFSGLIPETIKTLVRSVPIKWPLHKETLNERLNKRARVKFPGISLEEVERRVALFRSVDSSFPEVQITALKQDLFLIEHRS